MRTVILRPLLFLSLIFLIAPTAIFADQVDDYIRTVMAERHVPGVAVAVIKNGKVVKLQGYGIASVEFNVPVTVDTVFEIGSVSKQMTAAAILLLVEDGKVKLDAPISAYLPNTPEAWKDVTVRHLLTHSSGVKSYSSLDGFELYRHLKTPEFIKLLSPHPLEFIPASGISTATAALRCSGTLSKLFRETVYAVHARADLRAARDDQNRRPRPAVHYHRTARPATNGRSTISRGATAT